MPMICNLYIFRGRQSEIVIKLTRLCNIMRFYGCKGDNFLMIHCNLLYVNGQSTDCKIIISKPQGVPQ